MFVCTGCQGEPRAALSKIAFRTHPHIVLEEGDLVVFSSKIIPGNERSIAIVQNRLVHSDVEVVTEQDALVHVSGHPAREDLAELYSWVRPRVSVPVHGEARHLAEHAKYARSLQVPDAHVLENGSMLRLAPGRPEIVDHVESGRLYVDGNMLIRADGEIARERRKLLRAGSITVVLVLKPGGSLAARPQFVVNGVVDAADYDLLLEGLTTGVEATIDRLPTLSRRRDDNIKDVVRRSIRSSVKGVTGTRPLVEVQIVRLFGGDDVGPGRSKYMEVYSE